MPTPRPHAHAQAPRMTTAHDAYDDAHDDAHAHHAHAHAQAPRARPRAPTPTRTRTRTARAPHGHAPVTTGNLKAGRAPANATSGREVVMPANYIYYTY